MRFAGQRRVRKWMAVSIVAGIFLFASLALRRPVPDPIFQGSRASVWFRQMLVHSASLGRLPHDDQAYLEARVALLRLGTNAAPFLADQMLHPPSNGPLRRLLLFAARELDLDARVASFVPPAETVRQARDLLVIVRPSAEALRPFLEPALRDTGPARAAALEVLSTCRDDHSLVPEFLREIRLGTSVRARHAAAIYLGRQPLAAAEVVPPVIEALETHPEDLLLLPILSGLGDGARAAVPAVESAQARHTNRLFRIAAAMTLLEIAGHHPGSAQLLRDLADNAVLTPWNHWQSTDARQWCGLLEFFPPPRNPATLDALEALARKEIDHWESRGLAHQASDLLARIAPDRAAPLFAAQVASTNRTNVRIVAAGRWLIAQRTNTIAFAFLTNQLTDPVHHLEGMAAEQLQEAGPAFLPALRALQASESRAETDSVVPDRLAWAIRRIELRQLEETCRSSP